MSRMMRVSTEVIAREWDTFEHTLQSGWNMYLDHLDSEREANRPNTLAANNNTTTREFVNNADVQSTG